MKDPKLIDKLTGCLPEAAHHALEALARLAQERGLVLYLVGGPVRDLLLDASTLDLDLAIEVDARPLARQLAALMASHWVEHPAFLTATVKGGGFSIDLATARSEAYPHPGALPKVRPASIREDMLRRDFTINAMALTLTGSQRGELLDPCGGQADLEAGLVRVLHEGSFMDDATRIPRALRYAVRFGFRLEEQTMAWLRRDVGYLETISGARLRQEISRILQEVEPERALLRLQELAVLPTIHPSLSFDGHRARALATLRRLAPEAMPAAAWPLLAWDLHEGEAAALAGRLTLTKPQSQAVCALPRLRALEPSLRQPSLKPSQVVAMLSPYPSPAVWALATATASDAVRQRCLDYLRRWRYVKSFLDGHALLGLGVPPGPAVGEMLSRLKASRLNSEVRSRGEEERLVRSLLAHRAAENQTDRD